MNEVSPNVLSELSTITPSVLCFCCLILSCAPVGAIDTLPHTEMPETIYQVFLAAAGNYSHDVAKDTAFLKRLRNLPWPDFTKLKSANLYNTEFRMWKGGPHEQNIIGCGCNVWVLPSDGEEWTILRPDFKLITHRKSGFVLKPQDEIIQIDKVVRELASREDSSDRDAWRYMMIRDDCSCGFPFRPGVYLVNLAYSAAALGKMNRANTILKAAFSESKGFSQVLFQSVYNELAWQMFQEGLGQLVLGKPRKFVLAKWNETAESFPFSDYADQLSDYIAVLKGQDQDNGAVQRTSEELQKLPLNERIAAHLEDFQEITEVQNIQTGECPLLYDGENTVASDAIVRIGKPAIPALITHLKDRRLTRSFGFRRNSEPRRIVLRVQDVAIRCIEAILTRNFYRRSSSSSYFSTEPIEAQEIIIDELKKSWTEIQGAPQ